MNCSRPGKISPPFPAQHVVLIALEDLDRDKGLSTWKNSPEQLSQGQWVLFSGDVEHTFLGRGGGLAVFLIFGNLPLQVEIIRPLRIANILENVAQLKHCVHEVATLGKQRSTYYKGKGPVPMEVIRKELKNLPCGNCTWIYYDTTYGPKQIRQYKLAIIDKEFMKVSGARHVDPATVGKGHYFWSRDSVASGTPKLQELDWLNWLPNGAHVFFSPISPTSGEDSMKLLATAKRRHAEFGINLFPAFCIGLREMHLIINMVYDRADPES